MDIQNIEGFGVSDCFPFFCSMMFQEVVHTHNGWNSTSICLINSSTFHTFIKFC